MSTIGKSATRLWREEIKSGATTLSFAAWISRKKEMLSADAAGSNLILIDKTLNDSVQSAIAGATEAGRLQSKASSKTIFGINKTLFIISAIVVVAGGVVLITQISKK